MAYEPIISASNFIPFIRTENYSKLQNDSTRLYYDLTYQSIENRCYTVKLVDSYPAWFQYHTDYEFKTCLLVDEDGNQTDVTSNIISIFDYDDGRKQYEFNMSLTGMSGKYYLLLLFDQDVLNPIYTFQSEWFEVADSWPNHLLIETTNNSDIPTSYDGIIWGAVTQKIWIESRAVTDLVFNESTEFITATGKQITTQFTEGYGKLWEVEPIPGYLLKIINRWLKKAKFYINGEWYSTTETIDTERIGDLKLYPFELPMRLVEDSQGYTPGDYTTLKTATGELPVVADILRVTDGITTRTTGLEDRKTNN